MYIASNFVVCYTGRLFFNKQHEPPFDILSTHYLITADPKVDLPSGHSDYTSSSAGSATGSAAVRCDLPIETALRELREEAGITAQEIEYVGTRIHRTAASFQPFGAMQRHYVFLQYTADSIAHSARNHHSFGSSAGNAGRGSGLGMKDFYNASSWTRPANIAAHMRYVDTAAAGGGAASVQNSKFYTTRKFCEPADVAAVLDASTVEVCAENRELFEAIRGTSGAHSSDSRFGGGSDSFVRRGGNSYVPPVPTASAGAAHHSAAHSTAGAATASAYGSAAASASASTAPTGRWNASTGGAGGSGSAYRPPSGSSHSDSNSFSNFTSTTAHLSTGPNSRSNTGSATASFFKPVTGTDKTLKCEHCSKAFVFTASDQQYYTGQGFNPPKRCKECRAIKKA